MNTFTEQFFATATPILDGDFKGHPFRGNGAVKAHAATGSAVHSSMRAKSAERRGDAKSASKAHETAHHAHKAALVEATGKAKKYHKIMAKFHGSRAGMAMDSVFDSIVKGAGAPPSGYKEASEPTQDHFNKWGDKPYHAVFETMKGGNGKPTYELTILFDGKNFIPAHGAVVMKGQAVATSKQAAAILEKWYEENNQPAAKTNSRGTYTLDGTDSVLDDAILDDSDNWHTKTMEAMKRKDDHALRFILKDATQAAEVGEKMGNPKSGQYRDEAHYASMEIQRRKKGGKQILDSADGDEPLFDLMFDDAGDFPSTVIGVISRNGEVAGRAHIAGDGKAMIFTGAGGQTRVQYKSSVDGEMRNAMWSDDDAGEMVAWLLAPATPAPTTGETDRSRLNAAQKLVSKEAITSDDPKAIEKLDAKLTALRLFQEFMKKANKFIKTGNDAGLLAMGLSQADIDKLKLPDFGGRVGFADYKLTNNNGVITATRKRMEQLIAQKQGNTVPVVETKDPVPEPIIEPTPSLTEVVDPILVIDTAYLNTFIDGTIDFMSPDILSRLEPMFTKYETDPAMMALLERAANAYGDAAVKAAQAALAG